MTSALVALSQKVILDLPFRDQSPSRVLGYVSATRNPEYGSITALNDDSPTSGFAASTENEAREVCSRLLVRS